MIYARGRACEIAGVEPAYQSLSGHDSVHCVGELERKRREALYSVIPCDRENAPSGICFPSCAEQAGCARSTVAEALKGAGMGWRADLAEPHHPDPGAPHRPVRPHELALARPFARPTPTYSAIQNRSSPAFRFPSPKIGCGAVDASAQKFYSIALATLLVVNRLGACRSGCAASDHRRWLINCTGRRRKPATSPLEFSTARRQVREGQQCARSSYLPAWHCGVQEIE